MLIGWGWGGNSAFLDLLEIQADRGDAKGWVFLTYDTTPNYTDTSPFPTAPLKWKYRAIYRVADARGRVEQCRGDHRRRVRVANQ